MRTLNRNKQKIYYANLEREVETVDAYGDPTGESAVLKSFYGERIDLIERTARATDEGLHTYILKAVTEEVSYTYLKTKMNIPCSRNTYYDRYRRFFWLLSAARD